MSERRKRRNWWLKAILGIALALLIPVVVLIGCRKTWIRPLPGVRVKMTRPMVRESDLGPDSAYRLLLLASGRPTRPMLPWGAPPVSTVEMAELLTRLRLHGWPADPPTPDPPGGLDLPAGEERLLTPPLTPSWSREQCEDIQQLLALYEPKIALLDRALAAPDPQMPTPDAAHGSTPDWSRAVQLAQWLAVSAECRAATGNHAGAFRDLGRAVDMGNLLCRGGGTTKHRIAIACQTIAMDSAWQIAAQHDVPLPVLRQAARQTLLAAARVEPVVEALRANALRVSGWVAHSDRAAFLILFSVHGRWATPPRSRRLKSFLVAILPIAGSTRQTISRNLECVYQHGIALAQTPYSAKTKAAYGTLAPRPTGERGMWSIMLWTRDPVGYLWAADLADIFGETHRRATRRDAMLRGTALFLALKAYEIEHGTVPERLERLVPEYLPHIPSDPFDGKPFRYLKSGVPGLPLAAWAVYSVGEDFTDDGGTVKGVGGLPGASDPDLVWPSQPYPAEEH